MRSQTDAGPPKMRLRFNASIATWTFTLGPMSGGDRAVLLYHYRTTTKQGTEAFDWFDENGAAASFRYAAPPRSRIVSGHHVPGDRLWEASLVLEILP